MSPAAAQGPEPCDAPIVGLGFWHWLGVPDVLVAPIFLILVALALTPLLAGQQIAGFKVPDLKASLRRLVATVAVFLLVAVLAGYAPLISSRTGFAAAQPELLEPQSGSTFDRYPRQLSLKWRPIREAARYQIEVGIQDIHTGDWFPEPNFGTKFSTNTELEIDFMAGQPGRWRVFAINARGEVSRCSSWWTFDFTK